MSTRDDRRQAAALGYSREHESAPRVLAKGGGEVAENIIAHAEAHGIPIEHDPDLLQCLAPLAVGDEIPVEAYVAVAQILAFLYQVNAE
ncbi:MAG: EscU/YscU/HrcU family type III secretion system export apparatus switch protein [Planctomycetes bacterium]|nr:EscU/YscU/HrcU family type III secretion system export apparatus switch protein [Planctomycetota bacterium]